jgi:hypothetical protein
VKLLRKITANPWLNAFVGIIFMVSGVVEMLETLEKGDTDFHVHHGVILFALLNTLKNLPDLFEGLEYIEKTSSEG